jgi:hypothetical protein
VREPEITEPGPIDVHHDLVADAGDVSTPEPAYHEGESEYETYVDEALVEEKVHGHG